jgi:hypothetical protein
VSPQTRVGGVDLPDLSEPFEFVVDSETLQSAVEMSEKGYKTPNTIELTKCLIQDC